MPSSRATRAIRMQHSCSSGMMEVLKAEPRRRQDQERLRNLHRRLEAGQCPEEHGAVPDLHRQQGRCGACLKTTAWPRASSRRLPRRAWPAFRSVARTVTWPRSTASLSARRPFRSGRTPSDLGKVAAEAANALAEGTAIDQIAGVGKFADGKNKVEMNAILLAADPDHEGQRQRRHRRWPHHQGTGMRRRRRWCSARLLIA